MPEQELPVNQDDELDVEELEEVAGGNYGLDAGAEPNNGCNNCPNTNCPC
jgi:hypothetical protein